MKRLLALVTALMLMCASVSAETAVSVHAPENQLTLENIQALNGGKANAYFDNDRLCFLLRVAENLEYIGKFVESIVPIIHIRPNHTSILTGPPSCV